MNADPWIALEEWEKATGGLPPELVAKALGYAADCSRWDTHFDADEARALRAATFEVGP